MPSKIMVRYDVEDRGIEEYQSGALLAFSKVKSRRVAKPQISAKRRGRGSKIGASPRNANCSEIAESHTKMTKGCWCRRKV